MFVTEVCVCVLLCFHLNAYKRVCVFSLTVCILMDAGRDQSGVCLGLGVCGCCCTIKSHQFSPVNKLA